MHSRNCLPSKPCGAAGRRAAGGERARARNGASEARSERVAHVLRPRAYRHAEPDHGVVHALHVHVGAEQTHVAIHAQVRLHALEALRAGAAERVCTHMRAARSWARKPRSHLEAVVQRTGRRVDREWLQRVDARRAPAAAGGPVHLQHVVGEGLAELQLLLRQLRLWARARPVEVRPTTHAPRAASPPWVWQCGTRRAWRNRRRPRCCSREPRTAGWPGSPRRTRTAPGVRPRTVHRSSRQRSASGGGWKRRAWGLSLERKKCGRALGRYRSIRTHTSFTGINFVWVVGLQSVFDAATRVPAPGRCRISRQACVRELGP